MDNKIVVLFNGAPASGKDTCASIMKELFKDSEILAFKDTLYKDTAKLFGVDCKLFKEIATDRDLKEKKTALLRINTGGFIGYLKYLAGAILQRYAYSPREALIYTSEKVIKPKYGLSYYGNKLAQDVLESDKEVFFVPDSGFIPELQPLVDAGHNILVVRLFRSGYSFEGDSRTQFEENELIKMGVNFVNLHNDGDLEELKESLISIAVDDVCPMFVQS